MCKGDDGKDENHTNIVLRWIEKMQKWKNIFDDHVLAEA